MNGKETSSPQRRNWLNVSRFSHRDRLKTEMSKLRPTLDTMLAVINQAPKSAPGPDGIPFDAYKACADVAAPILLDVIDSLIADPTTDLPSDFNACFLAMIPTAPSGRKGTTTTADQATSAPPASSLLQHHHCNFRSSQPWSQDTPTGHPSQERILP